jgi:uncharacterized phage protein (TIGR01671 family)
MDRFKFRAWHKECKGYYYFDLYNLKKHSLDEFEDDDIEQSTGLKDNNGMSIYEGDVLKDHRGDVCIVVWDKDIASFTLIKTDLKTYYSPIDTDITNFEIIGNIHENPELLEDK